MGASIKVKVKMVPKDYLRVGNSSNGIITNTLNKKWSFPLKISSVNVTKSARKKSLMESFVFCAAILDIYIDLHEVTSTDC